MTVAGITLVTGQDLVVPSQSLEEPLHCGSALGPLAAWGPSRPLWGAMCSDLLSLDPLLAELT